MTSAKQLQTNNRTFLGRYWVEHSVLRRYFPDDEGLSILSFGCSTGEELLFLRTLFPGARLYGCDIDWRNLQQARALLKDSAGIFHSSDGAIAQHGPYDIILCNSVLLSSSRHAGERVQGIDPRLWLHVVGQLDSVLKPGGVLQIINSNIPFRFHPVFKAYEVLPSSLICGPHFVDQFDLEGRVLCFGVGGVGWTALPNRHVAGEGEAWQELLPSDLEDAHFRKRGTGMPCPEVNDELIPNLAPGASWASGTTTYRPDVPQDGRLSSYTEVDVTWRTLGVSAVRLERVARRKWFDGTIVSTKCSMVDLDEAEATAFIESMLGRRSSHMALEGIWGVQPVRSPHF